MTMRCGIILKPDSVASAVDEAMLAERSGFDLAGVADSQSVYREPYVTLAACAAATRRVRLMPSVSNAITRHPAVAASAVATLDELAPGRVGLGLGSGDSAVLNLGERPSRLAEMREYLLAVRGLLQRRAATYHDHPIAMSWSPGHEIPLYLAAEGPRTLELAGELCDGVIINPGITPELIGDALDRIAAGARRADRDPAALDVHLMVRVNVCDDRAAGLEEIAMELASNAHHVFRFTTQGKRVPEDMLEAIARVQTGYVPAEHEHNGGANAAVITREPALLDYLADRFAVVGTAEQCADQLTAIAGAGVTSVLFTGFVNDRPALIRALGEEVLPRVRHALATGAAR